MAFRWFRKNKQATKWIYIFITIFVMLTFSITGAMVGSMTGDRGSGVAGTFRTPSGKQVEVSSLHYGNISRLLSRIQRNPSSEQVWTVVMLDELGKDAGIAVNDGMVADFLRDNWGLQSQQQLNDMLAATHISEPDFKKVMRMLVRATIYQSLNQPPRNILSEEKFHRFQTDNELFKVRYVAFEDEAEEAKLRDSEVSEEDLQAFYETDMNAQVKKNDFSTPERFHLQAAMLDPQERSNEDLRALLPENQRTVADTRIDSYRQRLADRYPEEHDDDDADDDDADDDGADDDDADEDDADEDDEHAGHDHGDDEEEDDDEGISPELRERIEHDILADLVITQAYRDFLSAKGERDSARAKRDAAKQADEAANEGDANEEEAAESTDPEPDPIADKTFDDLMQPIIEKYGLRLVDFEGMKTLEEVKDIEEIGAKDLETSVRFMRAEDLRSRVLSPDVKSPYLLICREKVEAEPLPFAEVKDRLKDQWVSHQASKNTQAAADAFVDALKEKAREKEAEKVNEIEKRARDEADEAIAAGPIEGEDEKQAVIDGKLSAVQPEIDAVIRGVMGEFFDEVLAAQGLTAESTDYFRKSYSRTTFYRDEEPSIEKFLKGLPTLFFLEVGQVMGPNRDAQNKAVVVAQVEDRKKPTVDQMRLGDWSEAEMSVMRDKFQTMFGPAADPFSFDNLSLRLSLKRPDPDAQKGPAQ